MAGLKGTKPIQVFFAYLFWARMCQNNQGSVINHDAGVDRRLGVQDWHLIIG